MLAGVRRARQGVAGVGVGGKLLSAIKSSYEEASACVKISGETSEHFEIKVGLRRGCVMSPWLFNIYMDGVMREMKSKVGEVGVGMYAEGRKWMQEYVRERGGGSLRNLEQARRECQDRERWKLFCRGHPLVGAPRSRCQNE